ncbi:MAG: glycosyltransferase family 39 protein [Candidatus Hinthialibacter antarcticus]|nr:glycosyltransferase family 39 protein [Candidatus Hinthialibacter antarcticus]
MTEFIIFILTAIAFTLGLMPIGDAILKKIGLGEATDNRAFAWGIGAFVLTYVLSILGLIGFYTPTVLWGFWGACLLMGLLQLPRWLSSIFRAKELRPSESGWTSVALRIGTGVMLLVILSTVMTPETRHDPYDYHLSGPNQYILAGQVVELPWHVFTYMPKNGEILYGLALTVGNDSLAKLIHFIFGCFILRLLYDWLKREHGYEAGLMAAFLAASLPLLGFVAVSAYIDLIRAFWELLALYCLYQLWVEPAPNKRSIWMVIAALFAGMAVATKYVSGAVFFPPFVLLYLITWFKFRNDLRWLPLLGGVVYALPLAPWMCLNGSWTGNPLYPFLPSLFGMNTPSAQEAYVFFKNHAPPVGVYQNAGTLLQYFAHRVWMLMLEGNALFLIGIAGLLAAPLRLKQQGEVRELPRFVYWGLAIYVSVATFLFLALCNNDDGRFFLSVLLILSIPATFFFFDLRRRLDVVSNWAPYLLPVIVFLILMNGLGYRNAQISAQRESMLPILTDAQRHVWLTNRFQHYPVIRWANDNLAPDAFVIGLGYPLRRKCAARLKYGYFPFAQSLDAPSADELAQALTEAGVTHIYEPFIEVKDGVELSILKERHLEPVFTHRGSTLHLLKP